MDIFFCDVCCARVSANHLSRGHGVRNKDIIICGSCLEKGHGAELLEHADQGSIEAVAAAPRLAGAEALNESRDRAATMKNLEPVSGDASEELEFQSADETDSEESLVSESDKSSSVIEEAEEIVAKAASEEVEEPIDLSDIGEGDKITELPSEPELDMDSPDELEAVDVDDADRNKTNVPSDSEDDAIELEAADNEVLSDGPDPELDEEPSPGSSSISADDAIDDLDDSGHYAVQDQDRLEDADDGDHTDSYSADELAAIRRLAEKDKKSSQAKSDSQTGPSAKTSGRRKKTSSSKKSGRKAAASARRSTAASPKTSGRNKTSSRSKSRKTSTRANASAKQGMPLPLLVSFITVPLIIILFVVVMPGNSEPTEVKESQNTSSDLRLMAKEVLSAGSDAYNSEDLGKLRKVMAMYGPLVQRKDAVAENLKRSGWTDNQIDKEFATYRKAMQMKRSISEKIIEVENRR